MSDVVEAAAASIRGQVGNPTIGIVLGSGLGDLADAVEQPIEIPYSEIAGFPTTTVVGHSGKLVAGDLCGSPVLLQSGRFHLYEGHDPATVVLPVRTMARLGVKTLIVTNAAGGVRRSLRPPSLMLITDHINLMNRNPLAEPVKSGEERFPDMSAPYDEGLARVARTKALQLKIELHEGVYAGLLGPNYETPAEIRMLERLGADAVGMSTVPEVIVARANGLHVLGISSITNPAAGTTVHSLDHEEVLEAGKAVAANLRALVEAIIPAI